MFSLPWIGSGLKSRDTISVMPIPNPRIVGSGFKTALVVFVDVVHGCFASLIDYINGKQAIAIGDIMQLQQFMAGIFFDFKGAINKGIPGLRNCCHKTKIGNKMIGKRSSTCLP